MDFVSVERVVELLNLDQEDPGAIEPPASWPSMDGDIEIDDVTMRYADHLPPALRDLTLIIKGGSSTAVVGRTGSGKSSLAIALLAAGMLRHSGRLRPARADSPIANLEKGRILIDGVDISKVKKQTLRQRVVSTKLVCNDFSPLTDNHTKTFIAQEPLLFAGTLRRNLDPLDEFGAEACDDVVRRVCNQRGWSSDTRVEAGGLNLSQGQRQLVGIARAVLRRSPIVILDEVSLCPFSFCMTSLTTIQATASIDMKGAMDVQRILREEMKASTVITIAHRAEAVQDATAVVVLRNGRVLESKSI